MGLGASLHFLIFLQLTLFIYGCVITFITMIFKEMFSRYHHLLLCRLLNWSRFRHNLLPWGWTKQHVTNKAGRTIPKQLHELSDIHKLTVPLRTREVRKILCKKNLKNDKRFIFLRATEGITSNYFYQPLLNFQVTTALTM